MNLKYIFKTAFFSLVMLSCVAVSNNSYSQRIDGTYYDWTVFEMDDTKYEKKCYITSFPKKSIGNHKQKREPYILITRFKNKGLEEVSIFNGYKYKINSEIHMAVENRQYSLFTNEDLAWAKTPEQDKEMIQEMLKGRTLKVRGESNVGTYSVDEYSLKGIVKAYRRMKELCRD